MKIEKHGRFIVFEGIDGAGTTTQSELLFNNLKSNGIDCLLTREPWNSHPGILATKAIKKEKNIGATSLQLLFCADRAEHLEKEIIPALEEGKIVICDRYYYSTLVFGELSKVEKKLIEKINDYFLKPDICFLLDCDPEIALGRIKKRGEKEEKFEKLPLLREASKIYKKISRLEEVIRIDGNKSKEEIFSELQLYL